MPANPSQVIGVNALRIRDRFVVTLKGNGVPANGVDVFYGTAAENLSALRVVMGNGSGGIIYADQSDGLLAGAAFGITTTSATTGNQVTIQTSGELIDSGWSWTPGPIWLGTNGTLTQVEPVAPNALVQVARAVTATKIIIDIEPLILKA